MAYTPEQAGAFGQENPEIGGAFGKIAKKYGSTEIKDLLAQPDLTPQERALLTQRANKPKNYADGGEVEPEGLNEFLASPESQPGVVNPSEPEGLNEFLAPELKEAQYGTFGQQAKTALEGAAQGLVGPAAPAIEQGLGVNPEDIRARAETNPMIHGASELVGLVAPAFATRGASLLERAGLGAAAEALPAVAKATQFGALEAIQAKLGLTAGETLASKIGTGAAKAAIDNMLISGSDETSKMILQDPNQSAQTAIANIGIAGVLGARRSIRRW
jgi:hypothetical protein